MHEKFINTVVHDLLKIASLLKNIGEDNLSEEHKNILHDCEDKLVKIRQDMIESINGDNDE